MLSTSRSTPGNRVSGSNFSLSPVVCSSFDDVVDTAIDPTEVLGLHQPLTTQYAYFLLLVLLIIN